MSRLDNTLKDKCMGWLKGQPLCWGFKSYGNAVQSGGIPDIIMCVNGKFVAIELKRPDGKGKLEPRQQAQLKRIGQANGIALEVNSFEKFKEIVNDCLAQESSSQ